MITNSSVIKIVQDTTVAMLFGLLSVMRWLMCRHGLCALLFVYVVLCGAQGALADPATNERKVRVGWCEISGFQEVDYSGYRSGYAYDYYQEMSHYSGMSYEYVLGTWQECLDWLERGEIDVLAGMLKTEERLKTYSFSQYPMGHVYTQISVRASEQALYENYIWTLEDKTIGFMHGAKQIGALRTLLEKYSIHSTTRGYNAFSDLVAALDRGEIDCILSSNLRKLSLQERVVIKFAPEPLFFAVTKGNVQVLQSIDSALETVRTADPSFSAMLMSKYHPDNANATLKLDANERLFFRNVSDVRIAVVTGEAPLSYVEHDTLQGIYPEVASRVVARLDVPYTIAPAPSVQAAMDMLMNGTADLISGVTFNPSWAEQHGLLLSPAFLDLQYVRVMRKNFPQHILLTEAHVAAVDDLSLQVGYIEPRYRPSNVTLYTSVEECFEAVRDGKADIAFTDIYTAERLLQDYRFTNLTSMLINYSANVRMAFAPEKPAAFSSALNKALKNLSHEELAEITHHNVHRSREGFTPIALLYAAPMTALLIVTLIFLFFIFLLWFSKQKLQQIMHTDAVTGLPNYQKFLLDARHLLAIPRTKTYVLVYIDAQNFKHINDIYGHELGDALLTSLNAILNSNLEKGEVAARANADHFVALLWYDTPTTFEARLEYILVQMCQTMVVKHGKNYRLILRTGVYVLEKEDNNINMAIDSAIYAQKTLGRIYVSKIAYYKAAARNQLRFEKNLEQSMHTALKKGEFEVYCQPKVDITNRAIIGAEALIRWNHPSNEFMLPGTFIPFFEKSGFVTEIDIYVFEKICAAQQTILQTGGTPVPISSNYSRKHLELDNAPERFVEIFKKYNIPANLVEIELTEVGILEDMEGVKAQAEVFKAAGFRLAIDDFGSGHSSIQLLYQLPIDVLKLDKSVLDAHNGNNPIELDVMRSIVQIAQKNNIQVLCEGVENLEQEDILRSLGCTYAQGFLYARPLPLLEFMKTVQPAQPHAEPQASML